MATQSSPSDRPVESQQLLTLLPLAGQQSEVPLMKESRPAAVPSRSEGEAHAFRVQTSIETPCRIVQRFSNAYITPFYTDWDFSS